MRVAAATAREIFRTQCRKLLPQSMQVRRHGKFASVCPKNGQLDGLAKLHHLGGVPLARSTLSNPPSKFFPSRLSNDHLF